MSTITFDVAEFRVLFPAFSNAMTFPTSLLQSNWDFSTCFISDNDYGYLNGACRERAIMLLAAHLTSLGVLITSNEQVGLVNSATIDKVSVSLTPPPTPTQFSWWLNLTPYGAQLLTLLSMKAVGGAYVGGQANYPAFRKPAGRF